jgi:hypothetical protein
MNCLHVRSCTTAFVAITALSAVAFEEAEQAPAGDNWLRTQFQEDAATYEFFRDEAHNEPLKFVEKSIFHWKQDDDWRGDLFVWTWEDRPEVVGCILASNPTGSTRTIAHEFHQLTEKPLPMIRTASGSWHPKAGTPSLPLETAPKAAATDGLRLAELRNLARQFSVTMDSDGKPWELRLLPQPLYRYSSSKAGIIDGAIFAFVWTKGTDPEFLLRLECLQGKDGVQWNWTPIRFTTRSLVVHRNDQDVWSCPIGNGWQAGEVTEPYMSFFVKNVNVPADAE